jgi:hydroxyacylglutathione hydrolase
VGNLPDKLEDLPADGTLVTLCGSGRRALIAASLLRRHGRTDVQNCFGSMAACKAVGCELEEGSS